MSETSSFFEEGTQPEKIENQEYHFEQMAEVEPSMILLVKQLKPVIESREYSAFLSDDAGGRIPTLVLKYVCDEIREKLKEKYKDDMDKIPTKIKTYFLAGGKTTPRKESKAQYKEMTDYMKTMDFGNKKVLVITQLTDTGETLEKIGLALKDTKDEDGENIKGNQFDFASLFSYLDDEAVEKLKQISGSELFSGGFPKSKKAELMIYDHERFSGIKGSKNPESLISEREYSPIPKRAFPYNAENQNQINKSREDLKLMAKKVVEEVWPELK